MSDKADHSLTRGTLTKLAGELEKELQKLPLYREFLTVQRALADLDSPPTSGGYQRPPHAGQAAQAAHNYRHHYIPRTIRMGRITAIGAAMKALEAAGRPLSIHELVEAVPKFGFEIKSYGAKRPASALATYLNKKGGNGPIVSVWIDNKPMWWFRDQPVPGAEVA